MGYEVVNGDGLAYRDWACGIGLFVASDVPPTSVDGVAFVEDDEYTLYNPSKEDATTVPDHLLRCPGLVDDITEHILRYRRYGYDGYDGYEEYFGPKRKNPGKPQITYYALSDK